MFCVIPVGYRPICESVSKSLRSRNQPRRAAEGGTRPRSTRWIYPDPGLGNTVPYLVLDHQHTQAFELLSQLLDIKADNAVVDIHIGTVVKNIQTAMHIQFQRCRNPLRLRLRLPLDLVIQIFQQRHILRARVCNIGAVHDPHGTVNDRLFHWLQTVPAAAANSQNDRIKSDFNASGLSSSL